MTVIDETTRFALQQRAREVLGEQEGDTLMAHLPPVGWADIATKSDVAHLAERIEHCATTADMERGFRRQSMWIVTLFVTQNAFFLYVAEQLAN